MEEYNHIKEKINEYSKEEQKEIVENYWGRITEKYTPEQIEYITYYAICKKEIDEFCRKREEERKKKYDYNVGNEEGRMKEEGPSKKLLKWFLDNYK